MSWVRSHDSVQLAVRSFQWYSSNVTWIRVGYIDSHWRHNVPQLGREIQGALLQVARRAWKGTANPNELRVSERAILDWIAVLKWAPNSYHSQFIQNQGSLKWEILAVHLFLTFSNHTLKMLRRLILLRYPSIRLTFRLSVFLSVLEFSQNNFIGIRFFFVANKVSANNNEAQLRKAYLS